MATPADRWIDAWFRAWSGHEPDALADCYAPGPVQRSAPFRERIDPREYAVWAFAGEAAVEVWFAEPAVLADGAAACEWWAVTQDHAGALATLSGVSLLRFDDEGRVVDQRDYWSERDGAQEPPADWGPTARHA